MAAKDEIMVLPRALPAQGAAHSFEQLERMAEYVAQSRMLPGVDNKAQAMTLMLLSQAEGRHPLEAQQRYHIVKGRPSKKAEAMLADFIESGGNVEWHERSETRCDATFSHVSVKSPVRITWDLEMARKAQLMGNDGWKKYPRAMLHARTASEGVRAVYPKACHGMYTPEEVGDMVEDRFASLPQEEPREAKVMQIEQVKPSATDVVYGGLVKQAVDVPPPPKMIESVPDWMAKRIKPLSGLAGVPFYDMDDDDVDLVIDACTKSLEQKRAAKTLSENGGAWLLGIISVAKIVAQSRAGGDEPPPNDDDAPAAGEA